MTCISLENELSYGTRKQKQNMIVAGVWISAHKLLMDMFKHQFEEP